MSFSPKIVASILALTFLALVPKPVKADTANFTVFGSTTVTLPTVTDISYSLISNVLTTNPTQTGDSGLTVGATSFSQSGWTLTYTFDPSTGFVSDPSGNVGFAQFYATFIQVTNTSSSDILLPILGTVTYGGGTNSISTTFGTSQISQEVLQIEPGGDNQLALICVDSNANCLTYVTPGPGIPAVGPLSMTADFVIPANSNSTFEIYAQSLGIAGYTPAVPEPSSLIFLSTGVGLITCHWRRRTIGTAR